MWGSRSEGQAERRGAEYRAVKYYFLTDTIRQHFGEPALVDVLSNSFVGAIRY